MNRNHGKVDGISIINSRNSKIHNLRTTITKWRQLALTFGNYFRSKVIKGDNSKMYFQFILQKSSERTDISDFIKIFLLSQYFPSTKNDL